MHRPHNRVSDTNMHLALNTVNDVPYYSRNKDQSKSGWEVDILKYKDCACLDVQFYQSKAQSKQT